MERSSTESDLVSRNPLILTRPPQVKPSCRYAWVSLGLSVMLLLLVLSYGLLPGLLALCLGFLVAQALVGLAPQRFQTKNFERVVALVVGALPIVAIVAGSMYMREALPQMQEQLYGLALKLSDTFTEWRASLSTELAAFLPEDIGLGQLAREALKARGWWLAMWGQSGAAALLQVVVGMILGALIFLDSRAYHRAHSQEIGPLLQAVRERGRTFGETFQAIVVAQSMVAMVNAGATALYLYVILPLFGVTLPSAGALVAVTLIASLVPAVGNIFCNVLLTLVSLSVGPAVAAASLIYLVLIHKTEYFISAMVVGERMHIKVWEIVLAIVMGQAIFGLLGIVAGPLYYAYVKNEIASIGIY